MIAGGLLLWNPYLGLATLTYVLNAFFYCRRRFRHRLAIAHRRELTGKWEWMMFNGVIDLILAGNPRLSRHARMGVCILRHFKACQQLDIAGCTVNGCFPGAVGLGRGPESRPFRLNLIASLSLVPGAPLD